MGTVTLAVAANTAAENIRQLDAGGTILMFSKEKIPFYYVPALPEFVKQHPIGPQKLALSPPI